jgi:choline dehydrogenase-like flavoprotein
MVHHIETDESGRATAVRYFDWQQREVRIEAQVVVVACSAVESARLLLLSRGKAHGEGLGNAHGQVGRNLMFCGLGMGQAEFPVSDPRMQAIDWREPFINRSFQDLYLIHDAGQPPRKGGTVNFLLPHGNPIYRAEQLALSGPRPLFGQALKDAIRRVNRDVRTVEFEVYSETLPAAASQVTLDPEVKDRFGLPAARFTLFQHPLDAEANGALVDRGMQVLHEMGGQGPRVTRKNQKNLVLQGGTCRFGADPGASVLDPDCRVHDAPNVFVTDGSFMPTLGGVPNTLTIQANAFRVADRIIALGRAHELFSRPR